MTEVFGAQTPRELRRLRERFLRAPGARRRPGDRAPARAEFDLAWIVFAAPHLAGHRLWGDPALDEIYEEVDAQLGRVLEALPDDCDVIACSVLGMDVNTSRADLLPGMLSAVLAGEQRRVVPFGRQATERNHGTARTPTRGRSGGCAARSRGRAARPVAAAMPDRLALELTARLELRGVDWSATRAFAHPADNQGYIRLNRAGRERDGIVGESEATELIDADPRGPARLPRPRRRAGGGRGRRGRASAGTGDAAERLPDLVVRWRPTSSVDLDALHSPRFGTVRRQGAGSGRTGNHTDGDAWAILAPRTSRLRNLSRPARVTDIAATVAAISGRHRSKASAASPSSSANAETAKTGPSRRVFAVSREDPGQGGGLGGADEEAGSEA